MSPRTMLTLLATILFLGVSAAYAQPAPRGGGADIEPASSKVIDGVTYYYDADGNPLYYDDPVHYNRPRRFYYRDGGWVMARSNYGHHHSRYANTGLHKRRGQAGQNAQTGGGTRVSGDAATRTKKTQLGSTSVRKGGATGQTGTAKAAQKVGTDGNASRKSNGVRIGTDAHVGGGTPARKAGSPGAAGATTGGQGGSAGKAGGTASGGQAGKSGKSGSSAARGGAAGSSGGKHAGSGKAGGGGGSGGRRGPK